MGGFLPTPASLPSPYVSYFSGAIAARLSVSTPGTVRARPLQKASRPCGCSPECRVSADNWEQAMCRLGTGRATHSLGREGTKVGRLVYRPCHRSQGQAL